MCRGKFEIEQPLNQIQLKGQKVRILKILQMHFLHQKSTWPNSLYEAEEYDQ